MNARIATELLQRNLQRRGINASFAQANILRRAEITLQHWFENECGNSNDYCSWAFERDPETDKPYRVTYFNSPRGWYVWCQNAGDAHVKATSKRFASYDEACAYEKTVARGWKPYVKADDSMRTRIPDREAGARRRIAAVCAALGCFHYVQTDPRGCALYVSAEPFAEFDHTNGVACCA